MPYGHSLTRDTGLFSLGDLTCHKTTSHIGEPSIELKLEVFLMIPKQTIHSIN